ncbi:MAG: type III-B CRISPR module-associated protein Cmr3 [Zetaproteobacteria bacterium]|nr:MAG: type III-B CRISPR module-associated protein Cmr3 [Zetaproteobacteria bacterium]
MGMSETLFLEPIDALYLRGNRLFGVTGGDDAPAQMPPWPSAVAGAIRSRMLVDGKVSLTDFAAGEASIENARLGEALGTPENPGSFRIARFSLARRRGESVEPLLPLPADWTAFGSVDDLRLAAARPAPLPQGVQGSVALEQMPRLSLEEPEKALSGFWLTFEGLARWLRDEDIKDGLVPVSELWRTDARLGIAMDARLRTAERSRIYTSDAVALARDVGFLAEVEGADGLVPRSGLLRFGGDGRGVRVHKARVEWPEPDWDEIRRTGRFRLLLTSPGIFEDAWKPRVEGARLVAAAVPRGEVVSGWDLAKGAPKPAQRCAPTGSVYWFDGFRGDIEDLKRLARKPLPSADPVRIAEGFNTCLIGNWKEV